MCHCLVLGPPCTVDLTTFERGSILLACAEDKEDFLYTSGRRNGCHISSILDHSSRGPRLSSTEGGAQQQQEQKQGESHSFLPWQPKTPQIQRCLVDALRALT